MPRRKADQPIIRTARKPRKPDKFHQLEKSNQQLKHSPEKLYPILDAFESGQPLVALLKQNKIEFHSMYRLFDNHKELRQRYSQAKENHADTLLFMVISWLTKADDLDRNQAYLLDVKCRNMLNVLAMLNPARYGKKPEQLSFGQGANIQVNINSYRPTDCQSDVIEQKS